MYIATAYTLHRLSSSQFHHRLSTRLVTSSQRRLYLINAINPAGLFEFMIQVHASFMKTTMAWLLMGLAAMTIPFAEALTCYDCVIDKTDGLSEVNTTCAETPTPSNTATCQGYACLITWSDYGNQGYIANLTCLDDRFGYNGPITVDRCPQFNLMQSQFKFYVYKDMCCVTTSKTWNSSSGSSAQYNETTCGCDKDYCNWNATAYWSQAPRDGPTTAQIMARDGPTTAQIMARDGPTTAPIMAPTTAINGASFGNRRYSDQYIYGFAFTVTFCIISLRRHLE